MSQPLIVKDLPRSYSLQIQSFLVGKCSEIIVYFRKYDYCPDSRLQTSNSCIHVLYYLIPYNVYAIIWCSSKHATRAPRCTLYAICWVYWIGLWVCLIWILLNLTGERRRWIFNEGSELKISWVGHPKDWLNLSIFAGT